MRLKLTLEEIATGVEKKIRLKHLKTCGTCNGRGGQGEETCPQCRGRGQVRRVQQSIFGQFVNVSTCPRCGGEGTVLRERCKTCGGEGRLSDSATVSVDGKPMGPARRYGGGMFGRGDWLELPPGRHRVTVTAPGYERRDLAVEVNDGADRERQKIDVSLARGEGG